jgi:acetylornithine deacetylase
MSALNDTLAELIRLNTVNPAYGDGGTESNAIPLLREFFQRRGIETREQEVFPGRHNLLARLPGRTQRRRKRITFGSRSPRTATAKDVKLFFIER